MATYISEKQQVQLDFLVQQSLNEVELGYRGLIAKSDGFYQRYDRVNSKLIDSLDFSKYFFNTLKNSPIKATESDDYLLSYNSVSNSSNKISIQSLFASVSGKVDAIHSPVSNIAELQTIKIADYYDEIQGKIITGVKDKTLIFVRSNGLYFYDKNAKDESTLYAPGDVCLIVRPNEINNDYFPGRWISMSVIDGKADYYGEWMIGPSGGHFIADVQYAYGAGSARFAARDFDNNDIILTYARKDELPSIVGLASEIYVQNYSQPKKGLDDYYVTANQLASLGLIHAQHSDDQDLSNLVEKVSGKSLIDDLEILRLSNVFNYNDSIIFGLLDQKVDNANNGLQTINKNVIDAINEINSKTNGKNVAFSFQTLSELNLWLENPDNIALLVTGNDLYIIEEGVPDFWWDGTQKQELETKAIDLTEYVQKTRTINGKQLIIDIVLNADDIAETTDRKWLSSIERTDLSTVKSWIDTNSSSIATHLSDIVKHITSTERTNWNNLVSFPGFGTTHGLAAYGDHNHDGVYLSSFVETDPIFTAWNKSTGISITKSQISDFPTSLSQFINDSGYLTSSSLSTYLPLTGGSMTGSITFDSTHGLAFTNNATIKNGLNGLKIYTASKRFEIEAWYTVMMGNQLYLQNITGGASTLIFQGSQSGTKEYQIMNSIYGMNNTGFSIRNFTDNTVPFYLDGSDNAFFKNYITATQYKVVSGTSSQFLKADGSLDSNTYLSGANLNAYLLLTGGTLTGVLNSSSYANFTQGLFKGDYFMSSPNGGVSITNVDSYSGAITIILPTNISSTMCSMWIDVYLYSTNTSFSVHVGGYTYTNSTWANNPFAMVYGADHTVRLGHDGNSFVIYIGETSSSWSYPQVSVRDVLIGYNPSISDWHKSINIGYSTSLLNVTATIGHKAWTTKNLDPTIYSTHRSEGTNYIDNSYRLYDNYRGGWRTSDDLYVNYAYNAGTATYLRKDFTGATSGDLLYSNIADNDFFRLRVGGTATNQGYVEFATADDGTEPFYFRQYTGVFGSLVRTLTLLDESGNTSIPGTLTTGNNIVSNVITSRAAQTSSYTTAALWTQSFDSTLTGIAFHISGIVGKMLYMNTDQNLYWAGNRIIDSSIIGAQSVNYANNSGHSDFANHLTKQNMGTPDQTGFNGIYYCNVGSTPAPSGSSDGTLIASSYYAAPDTWGSQIYQDYRAGYLYVRGRNNGSWSSWLRIIDSSNIGSQSVSIATRLNGPAHTNGSDGWFRSDGSTGWYNESYGVGIYAKESGNVRTYNGANFISEGNIQSVGDITVGGNVYINQNFGRTLVGVYNASRLQGIYTMGDSYKLPADGTSSGNLYGLAWSHPNAGGQASNLNTHGLLVMQNGTTMAAISQNIWIQGTYYGNGAGLSNINAAWANISGRPTNVSQFSNDSGYVTSSTNRWYDGWVSAPGYDANTIVGSKSGFSYSNNAPNNGALVHFDAGGYNLQLSSNYGEGGTGLNYRTRNGDAGSWNSWYTIFHSGNFTPNKETKLWAESHPNDFYLKNNWDGTYWQLTSNHGASVNVGHADNAGYANLTANVSINYNNDSNSTYQMLWGSGTGIYGTSGIYCNPATDVLYAYTFQLTSDIRSKQNISLINHKPIEVDFKSYEFINNPGKKHYGVIAQELATCNPELIETDERGYLSVNYIDLIMLELSNLRNEVKQLKDKYERT